MLKFYFEESKEDMDEMRDVYIDNLYRIIIVSVNMPLKKQLKCITEDINEGIKDILLLKFPSRRHKIMKDLLAGSGWFYEHENWKPKEVWIFTLKEIW